MRQQGKDILVRFQNRWQRQLWLQVFLYALGPSALVLFVTLNFLWTLITLIIVAVISAVIIKPWTPSLKNVTGFLDQKLRTAEYSTGLLLLPPEGLSGLARLQQQRISETLTGWNGELRPPVNLKTAGLIAALLTMIGFVFYYYSLSDNLRSPGRSLEKEERIIFRPADSLAQEMEPPILENQQVTISYPAYTNLPAITTTGMEVKAVEGSTLHWKLEFDSEVENVEMESMGDRFPMEMKEGSYRRSQVLTTSGFYNFRFSDTSGASYVSDLYSIEATKDLRPVIEIEELKQFATFEVEEEKRISFNAAVTDDYGIAEVFIVATVSKGTGESVKFREEKLEFDQEIPRGNKNMSLSKSIDLDEMKMEPGDELYFYVEAADLKQPRPNRTRSETYFAVIKDTTQGEFAVEGSLGVDLMPDYFRSQRQLIIDTEKLIADKPKLSKKEFNSTSNELGFDQKALRIRYGEFMGDESEAALDIEEDEVHDEDEDENPIAEFMHDHDGDNEHNLVVQEGEEDEEDDPLAEYLHNHDDPEESTLFTDNLKAKLRQALDIMWDAELQLRLYEPEKSLPYQYKALELIQDIKNSARIYVHRIGFDPPPIKEEARLSGKIEEVSNFQKQEDLLEEERFAYMKRSVSRLEELLQGNTTITEEDQELFEKAGSELAEKAIDEPGRYLRTLQQLKRLTEDVKNEREVLLEVQRGLLLALPKNEPFPGKRRNSISELDKLLLDELERNE